MRDKKRYKVMIPIGLVLLIFFVALILGNSYIEKRIRKELARVEGLEIDRVDYSMLTNTISFTGLILNDSSNTHSGKCASIHASGIDRMAYFRESKIVMNELEIEGADLYINLDASYEDSSTVDRTSYNMAIDQISFREGTIHFIKNHKKIVAAQEVHFRMHNFVFNDVDSFSIKDYFIRTGMISAIVPDDRHKISIESCEYHPETEKIKLTSFSYFTDISKKRWYDSNKQKKTRYNWKVKNIEIVKPDITSFLNHASIKFQKVLINESTLEVFEDMRFKHCHSCKKSLPHQQLLQAQKDIEIDSLQIKNSSIKYISNENSRDEWGTVEFDQLYASAHHISNNKNHIRTHPKILLDAETHIFGTTPLWVHFEFDLTKKNGSYSYEGVCEGFDFTKFNQFLKPIKQVMVAKGQSHGLRFNVKANESYSRGLMKLEYSGLKVAFLNNRKGESKVLSGFANTLAVKRNNEPGVGFRKGKIYHKRDKSRSIFKELSQGIQTGIQSTVLARFLLPPELQ